MQPTRIIIVGAWIWISGLIAAPLIAETRTMNTSDLYDVVWDSPSEDHHGSMPLGNGDIGLNAWIEPSGELVFYISKTDAWDDHGRLVKVGRIRLRLEPAPPVVPFRQQLRLREGTLEATFGEGAAATALRLWVDANRPVIQVDIHGARDAIATAAIELWRTTPYSLDSLQVSDLMEDRSQPGSLHQPVLIQPDTVLRGLTDRIGWLHHNRISVGPAMIAEIQGLADFQRPDPLLHRTFGAVIQAADGVRLDDTHLRSPAAKRHRFSIHVLSQHPATPDQWQEAMNREIAATERVPFEQRRREHNSWWADFWSRSRIHVTTNHLRPPCR